MPPLPPPEASARRSPAPHAAAPPPPPFSLWDARARGGRTEAMPIMQICIAKYVMHVIQTSWDPTGTWLDLRVAARVCAARRSAGTHARGLLRPAPRGRRARGAAGGAAERGGKCGYCAGGGHVSPPWRASISFQRLPPGRPLPRPLRSPSVTLRTAAHTQHTHTGDMRSLLALALVGLIVLAAMPSKSRRGPILEGGGGLCFDSVFLEGVLSLFVSFSCCVPSAAFTTCGSATDSVSLTAALWKRRPHWERGSGRRKEDEDGAMWSPRQLHCTFGLWSFPLHPVAFSLRAARCRSPRSCLRSRAPALCASAARRVEHARLGRLGLRSPRSPGPPVVFVSLVIPLLFCSFSTGPLFTVLLDLILFLFHTPPRPLISPIPRPLATDTPPSLSTSPHQPPRTRTTRPTTRQ